MRKCDWCGDYYYEGGVYGFFSIVGASQIDRKKHHFCSNKCYHEMLGKTEYREGKWFFCKYCKEPYRESSSTYKLDSNNFCSESCGNSYQCYLRRKSEQEEQRRIEEIRERKRKREKWERENPELVKQEKEKREREEEAREKEQAKKYKRYKLSKNLWFIWLMPITLFVLLFYAYSPYIIETISPIIDEILLYAQGSEYNNNPFYIYAIILPSIIISSIGIYFANNTITTYEYARKSLTLEDFFYYSSCLLLIPILFFVANWLWEAITVFFYALGFILFTKLKEGEELGFFTLICFFIYVPLRVILFIAYVIMYLFADNLPEFWLKGTLDIFLVIALSLLPLYIFFKMRAINKLLFLFTIGILLNICLVFLVF